MGILIHAYQKGTLINGPIKLPTVEVKDKAPTYIKYMNLWEQEHPGYIDKYVKDRFNNPVDRDEYIGRINEEAWKKKLRDEVVGEVAKKALLYQWFNPQDKDEKAQAELLFKEKFGTSPHRYMYDNNPGYRRYFNEKIKNASSVINYPITDIRRMVNPNNDYEYPNLIGKTKVAMTDFSNNLISYFLPIPLIDNMGKIPGLSKAFKSLLGKETVNASEKIINREPVIENGSEEIIRNATRSQNKKWELEELPGLHIRSTMTENPKGLHTMVSKNGEINVKQALNRIKKDEGPKKYALIKDLFKDSPEKMDYNEFRKTIQKGLIPLNKKATKEYADYGVNNIGINADEISNNETILLSNKEKLGGGSGAHFGDNATLGHIRVLKTKTEPNVLHAIEIQSDAFEGTNKIMPKSLEKALKNLKTMEEILEKQKEITKQAVQQANGSWKYPDGTLVSNHVYQTDRIDQEHLNAIKRIEIENFLQKKLLEKNFPERYLQEFVNYASKEKGIDKVRIPTSETAAKIQGFKKSYSNPNKYSDYSPEHKTILKRYDNQLKMIKKLFGKNPNIVTDNKGNTWYEFDIPKKFKEGKGEIKAFGALPPILGTVVYNTLYGKQK